MTHLLWRSETECCHFQRKNIFGLLPQCLQSFAFTFVWNILPKPDSHLLNSGLHNEIICKYNSSLFHEGKTFVKINILLLLKMNYLDAYSNLHFTSKFPLLGTTITVSYDFYVYIFFTTPFPPTPILLRSNWHTSLCKFQT